MTQALAEARPDALLVTGDIAHDPIPEAYQHFADIVTAHYEGPALCLAGNHDVGAAMGEMLRATSLQLGPWCIVALDSHADDQVEADVSAADLAQLAQTLDATPRQHHLVATNHPPIEVACPWLDEHRIQNGTELLESLAERPSVKGMVFGHAHQVVSHQHRHLPVLGTPSTCFQFKPRSERFAVDEQLPGYRWLLLHPDGTLVSSVERLAGYPMQIDMTDR